MPGRYGHWPERSYGLFDAPPLDARSSKRHVSYHHPSEFSNHAHQHGTLTAQNIYELRLIVSLERRGQDLVDGLYVAQSLGADDRREFRQDSAA